MFAPDDSKVRARARARARARVRARARARRSGDFGGSMLHLGWAGRQVGRQAEGERDERVRKGCEKGM